jgi:hypothetical protein
MSGPLHDAVHGILFVLRGHFGRSGTSNIMLDQIGKGPAEFLRACVVETLVSLLGKVPPGDS